MPNGGLGNLRDWMEGDRISSLKHQQQSVDALRELYGLIKGLINRPDPVRPRPFVCRIVSQGPLDDQGIAAADLTGAMYWMQRQYMKTRDGADAGSQTKPLGWEEPYEFEEMQRDEEVLVFPAMNLAELVDQSHLLNVNIGDTILVHPIVADSNPDTYRCHVFEKVVGPLWFKLSGKAAGYGKYLGRPLRFSTLPLDESDNMLEDDIGAIDPDDEEMVICNSREVGKSTWDLWDGVNPDDNSTLNPLNFLGTVTGRNNAGKLVALIDGFKWSDC